KIGQQREAQFAVMREGEMAPDPIDRDAEQFGVEARKLGEDLVVQGHLIAAHRAPVGRIKGENDWPTVKIAQRDLLVGRRVERKVRRWRAGAEKLCGF